MLPDSHDEFEHVAQDLDALKRLARDLVRDDHEADDLVQAALQAAWEQPHWRPGYLRAWLRIVMRNISQNRRRNDVRRARRERKIAGHEPPVAEVSPSVAAVQRETCRILSGAIASLEESRRQPMLLHYFGGLSVEQIAARLRVSPNTVSSRLRRARGDVREVLVRRYGADSWAPALLPVLTHPAPVLPPAVPPAAAARPAGSGAAGRALPGRLTALAVGVAVALGAALVWWVQPWSRPADAGPAAGGAREEPREARSAVLAEPPDRAPGALAEKAPQAAAAPPPQRFRLVERGSGRPMPGLPLRAAFLRPASTEERLLGPGTPEWFRPREGVSWRLGADTAVTGEDGTAVFRPPPGTKRLFVFLDVHSGTHSIEDYARGRRVVPVDGGGELYVLEMVPRGGTASGRVVDPEGRPVPGARVLVTYDWILNPPLSPHREAVAGPDGRFRVPHIANDQGGYRMEAAKPGFVAARSLAVRRVAGFGEDHEGIELVLEPAQPRHVTVVDAVGRPVAGAELVASPADAPYQPEHSLGTYGRWWRESASTDATGRARLDAVPAGAVALRVHAEDHVSWRGVIAGGRTQVELRLPEGRRLPVQVFGADGAPCPDATVAVFHAGGHARARTGEDGLAAAPVPREGPAVVVVAAAGHALAARTLSDAAAAPAVFRLQEERVITGRVADWKGREDGDPAPSVYLAGSHRIELPAAIERSADLPRGVGGSVSAHALLELDGCEPDEQGRFRFGFLAPGRYELLVGHRFRPAASARADAGDRGVLLRPGRGLDSRTTLDLRVEDAHDGSPVTTFFTIPYYLDEVSGRWTQQPAAVSYTEDGRKRLSGMAPGTYRFLVWAPTGFVTRSLPAREYGAGSHQRLLRLPRSAALRLRLLDRQGRPLAGVVASAATAEGEPIPFAGAELMTFRDTLVSGDGGELTLWGVPRHAPVRVTFRREGTELRRRFEGAGRGGERRSVVLDFTGAPASAASNR